MYAGIFIGNYAKSRTSKEHSSGTSMSQMELLRAKGPRFLWDVTIQCDTKIEARRPDIVVIDKSKKEVKIVVVTIPGDERVNEGELGKIEKYKVLKYEITKMWGMKEVIVIPVVVGALGAISKYNIHKKQLIGDTRILRLVLGC